MFWANKKDLRKTGLFYIQYIYVSYAWGAPTGQTPAQEPQSMQVSASITYLLSPSLIALTGHSAAQAPQLIQKISSGFVRFNKIFICL